MKLRKIMIGVMAILLTMGSPLAWSHPHPNANSQGWKYAWSHGWLRANQHTPRFYRGNTSVKVKNNSSSPSVAHAPEIDVASGTSALALLTGILLLTGERFRSRRR